VRLSLMSRLTQIVPINDAPQPMKGQDLVSCFATKTTGNEVGKTTASRYDR